MYGLWKDIVCSQIKYFQVWFFTSSKTLSYKSQSGAASNVYFFLHSKASSQIIIWNQSQYRKLLWSKKLRLAALTKVVIYHCSFRNWGNAGMINLYPLYGVLLSLMFISGKTQSRVAIWEVSDVVPFVRKFVNVIQFFWISSNFGILSFHHIFAESMAEIDSANTNIILKSFHSHWTFDM